MKPTFLLLACWIAIGGSSIFAQDAPAKVTHRFDAQNSTPQKAPQEIFLVSGQFTVEQEGENLYYEVAAQPLDDSIGLVGDSSKGSSLIQASVRGTRFARSTPRFGIGVHGQNGYRLVVIPAKKALELWKGEEVVHSVPYTWESGVWLELKLSAIQENDQDWSIEGKVWKKGADETTAVSVAHKDQKLRGQGKCSLFATPYSGTPIQFDDVIVEITGSKP